MPRELLAVFRRTASGAALLLIACSAASPYASDPAPTPGNAGAVQAATTLLYVCNQNDASVSVIDITTNKVVRTIDLTKLGFSSNAKPHHVAVEPDGSYWYVTLIGDGKIVKFDRNDRVVAQASFETPGMLALHPSKDLLFVGRSMTAVNPPPSIGVIRRSTMSLEPIDIFFPRPHAMVLQPETGAVYTASLGVNQMAAVDIETEEVKLTSVEGPQHALMQFAISPDGKTMVASGELSHQVMFFDITNKLQPKLVASVNVEAQPFDPIYTPDGKWVYLGNKAANAITVIDAEKRTVAKVIRGEGISQPHGTAVSPDGRYVYVSNNNLSDASHAMHAGAQQPSGQQAKPSAPPGVGTVVVIDTQTQAIVSVIPVGHNAAGIGLAHAAP
jgi:YVTN family beta-propeller protein